MRDSSVSGSMMLNETSNVGRALRRRLPVGAEPTGDGRTHFRVWAPAVSSLDVVIEGQVAAVLDRDECGFFAGVANVGVGALYRFRLDGDRSYPDPASRYQPEGPHGPSEIIDPHSFEWTDGSWRGVRLEGQVIYELHVGTFTREGTWTAAAKELPTLAADGITTIEMMPVADFEGRFGWGYDGVDLYAPTRLYGRPDDLRRFVDRAHALGLGVILDVVYNHLGPVGNYLRPFAPAYFTDRYENEWGDAINFDGDDAGPVREFIITNAGYWVEEFHFDGLRLDATHQIFDRSSEHVVAAIARRVRQSAAGRSTIVVAESQNQDSNLVQPSAERGCELDALWNDDYHHSVMVALTGRAEGYYSDFRGCPQELVSAARSGFLYQGQESSWLHQRRGRPAWGIWPARFINYIQNHDQVANSAAGLRGHQLTSAARWRAMTALTLLLPGTPMLFQGQEFSASTPFFYFAEFDEALNEAIRKGRIEFLAQFPSIANTAGARSDPSDPATFERSKLDFRDRDRNAEAYALHRDLLQLRRTDLAFRQQRLGGVDGCVLSPSAFGLRFFANDHGEDRLVIVNLGSELSRPSIAEPLLAPPLDGDWTAKWSSNDPKYGGDGLPDLWPAEGWRIPGETAVVLAPGPRREHERATVRRRTA